MGNKKGRDFHYRLVDAIIDQLAPGEREVKTMKKFFRGRRHEPLNFWSSVAEVANEIVQAKTSGITYIVAADGGDTCLRSKTTASQLIQLGSHRAAMTEERAAYEQHIRRVATRPMKKKPVEPVCEGVGATSTVK
jgi:hypothetical protein